MRHTLALLLALGCSAAPAPTRCTPGASVACVCPGVGTGAQVCSADGASYGVCACGVDGGGDAAGDVTPAEDRPAAMDVVTEDRPDVVAPDLCVCPDVPPQADVVDAAADVPSNRGTRGQACRNVGVPCSDGSLCMNAVSYQHTDSPRGICTSPCRDAVSTACRPTDAGAQEVCFYLRAEVTPHCLQRCSGAVRCPTSTRCSGQAPGPGMPLESVCIPEADP